MNETCNALLSAVRRILCMADLPLDVGDGCGDDIYGNVVWLGILEG